MFVSTQKTMSHPNLSICLSLFSWLFFTPESHFLYKLQICLHFLDWCRKALVLLTWKVTHYINCTNYCSVMPWNIIWILPMLNILSEAQDGCSNINPVYCILSWVIVLLHIYLLQRSRLLSPYLPHLFDHEYRKTLRNYLQMKGSKSKFRSALMNG